MSLETLLPGREVQSSDFLYLKVLSNDELLNTHWLELSSTERISIEPNGLEIDFYDLFEKNSEKKLKKMQGQTLLIVSVFYGFKPWLDLLRISKNEFW